MQNKSLQKKLKKVQYKVRHNKEWLIAPVILMSLVGSLSVTTVSSHASARSFLSHVERIFRLGGERSYHPSAQQQQQIYSYKQNIKSLQNFDSDLFNFIDSGQLNKPTSQGSRNFNNSKLIRDIYKKFVSIPNNGFSFISDYNNPYSPTGEKGWNIYKVDNISSYQKELKYTRDLRHILESQLPYSNDSKTWGGNSFHGNKLVAKYMAKITKLDGGGDTLTTYNSQTAYDKWVARRGETWNALMWHMEEGNLSSHIKTLNKLIYQHKNHKSPIHAETWDTHMINEAADGLKVHIDGYMTNHLHELENGTIGPDAHHSHYHHYRGKGRRNRKRNREDNGSGNSYIHDYHERPNPLETDTQFYKQKPKIANFKILQHKHPKIDIISGDYAGHDGVKQVSSPNWARATLRYNYVQFPLTRNLKNVTPIEVYWPDAVEYQGKKLGVFMEINPSDTNNFKAYQAYHSQNNSLSRFINVGKDFYDGITYRGFVKGRVSFRFVSDSAVQSEPITNSLLTFDSLNGERIPSNHKVSGSLDAWGRRAKGNRRTGEFTNYVTDLSRHGVVSSKPSSNIEQYYSHLLGDYVNGGAANKDFWDGTAGEDAALSGKNPSFFKNSIMYLANNNPTQEFDFGSGNGYAWWKLSTHNLRSHTELHKSATHPFLNSKNEKYTYTIKGKIPSNVGKIKDDSKAYHFYDSISRQDNIQNASDSLKAPIKRDGNKVNFYLSKDQLQKDEGKPYTVTVNVNAAHPDYKSEDKTVAYIYNRAHDQVSGQKVENSNRTTNEIQRQKKMKIVPPPNTPLKKYVSDIHHAPNIKHNGYDYKNGGILSHPNEEYKYTVKGNIPTAGYDNVWHEHHWQNTYTTPHGRTDVAKGEYPVSTHDYSTAKYRLVDSLPSKDVSAISVKANKSGLHPQITNGGKDIVMNVKGDDVWQNRGHYKITIGVKADKLLQNPIKNKSGWHIYFNGGKNKNKTHAGTIADGEIPYGQEADDTTDISTAKTKKYPQWSNKVPVEIKRIAAHVYNYNWNNSNNSSHKLFPGHEQSFGLPTCNGTKDTNPTSLNYKNYRYHKFFNTNDTNAELNSPKTYYGYVNSVFEVPDVSKDGKNGGHYRYIYPMEKQSAYGNSFSDTPDKAYPLDADGKPVFTSEENDLSQNSRKLRGNLGDGSHAVPVNFNPDGCGNNAYSNSGFTQNNYFPYLIPEVTTPTIPGGNGTTNGSPAQEDKSSRLVIDTDKTSHGLPFHLNMTAFNNMFDNDLSGMNANPSDTDPNDYYNFNKDFNGDENGNDSKATKITMRITTGNDTLYTATRPLASIDKNNHQAMIKPFSRYNTPEYPSGDNNEWNGFMDTQALHQAQFDNKQDLNTSNLNGNDSKQGFPVKVSFTLSNNPQQIIFNTSDIHSHAYTASKPTIRGTGSQNDSFGKAFEQNYQSSKTSNIRPNEAKFILPERTTKYGVSDNDTSDVRDSREEVDMHQPRHQTGKTGYGLTSQDIGIDYVGHIDAPKYAEHGTDLMTAYPRAFNAKDSEITDQNDPYNHTFKDKYPNYNGVASSNKMLATPMLHVDSKYTPIKNISAENKGSAYHLPSDLDTFSDNATDADSADHYFNKHSHVDTHGHYSDGDMHAGVAQTSYGYAPKELTENNDANDNSNGGLVRINPNISHNAEYAPYYADNSHWDEPYISDKLNDKFSLGHNLYGYRVAYHDFDHMNTNHAYSEDNAFHPTENNMKLPLSGEGERLFTPRFMANEKYPLWFESNFKKNGTGSRIHRLGGNFISIDEKDPITMTGHMYQTSNEVGSSKNDEFLLQPILTNPQGLFQIPHTYPAFPQPKPENVKMTDSHHHVVNKRLFKNIYDIHHIKHWISTF